MYFAASPTVTVRYLAVISRVAVRFLTATPGVTVGYLAVTPAMTARCLASPLGGVGGAGGVSRGPRAGADLEAYRGNPKG